MVAPETGFWKVGFRPIRCPPRQWVTARASAPPMSPGVIGHRFSVLAVLVGVGETEDAAEDLGSTPRADPTGVGAAPAYHPAQRPRRHGFGVFLAVTVRVMKLSRTFCAAKYCLFPPPDQFAAFLLCSSIIGPPSRPTNAMRGHPRVIRTFRLRWLMMHCAVTSTE